MARLDIIIAPDSRLKKKCEPIEKVDAHLVKFIDDMLQTMYSAPGVGLSAPQVGVHKRIIVVDPARGDKKPQPYKLINPEIVWASKTEIMQEEGCLSLPSFYENVLRPDSVKVRYIDVDNNTCELAADGPLSVMIQHEIDHLDGLLFVDHVTKLKRNMILRKLKKIKKQKVIGSV